MKFSIVDPRRHESNNSSYLIRELSNDQDDDKICEECNYDVLEPTTPSESRKSSIPISQSDVDDVSTERIEINSDKELEILDLDEGALKKGKSINNN